MSKEMNKRVMSGLLAGSLVVGALGMNGCAIGKEGMDNSTTSISDNIDDLKVETPILTYGHGSGDKVVYTGFTIGLEGYYAIKENMDKIDGWELYEKVGDTYKKIDGYEVETNIGETKIYVARAYVYNNKNVKIYSEYSNEYKVTTFEKSRVNIKLLDKDTKEYVEGAKLVLKDINGDVIVEFTTSNIDFYINGLRDGIYTLTQLSSSDGYHLNGESINFEVKGNDVDIVMYNTRMTEEEINSMRNEVISNLVDVFDTDYRRNINGEYYVLRLRDAYKSYCESNPNGKKVDLEDVPKYLFLKGTAFETRRKYKDEIEYEFANWNDDISTTKDWKTDVSLVRIRKNSFALYLYFAKELGYDSFGLTIGVKDSYDYLKPISQLSQLEKKELIEQYESDKEVISIIENNNKNVSLNDDDFNEEYYIYDMAYALNHLRMVEGLGYNICACFDVEKDNHNCAITTSNLADESSMKDNLMYSLPRYYLLKINDIKDGVYTFSDFSNNGSFVIADVGGEEFSVVMNDITIPLTDTLREKYVSFEDVPECAKAIVFHGNVNVFGNYLKPLSSLSKYEVERLCESYGYNADVISLVNDHWFGPLMGLVPVRHTEDPVMSNGLTKSMDEAILRGAEIAAVKSKILRRRGI